MNTFHAMRLILNAVNWTTLRKKLKSTSKQLGIAGVAAGILILSARLPVRADLIAGVDFEGATSATFDRTPDDYDLSDGITVSSGTASPVFDGWTLLDLSGNPGANGNLGNDTGARNAGATTPDFPARLENSRTGSWSITIAPGFFYTLDRIEFDVRAATDANGRDGQFTTNLETTGTYLWEDLNLPGRATPNPAPDNWLHVVVDFTGNTTYQNLTDQTVDFIWRAQAGAIDLDTILVYASSAVPEPSTLGFMSLGLILLRKRRKT